MLPDLKELYLRKGKLLSELENVEKEIAYLERPENLTHERMKMLEHQAMKQHRILNFKALFSFLTVSITVFHLLNGELL